MAIVVTQLYIIQLILKFFTLSGSQPNISLFDNEKRNFRLNPSASQHIKITNNDFSNNMGTICKKKLYISTIEAQELGMCVFNQITQSTFYHWNIKSENLNDEISKCIRQVKEMSSKISCSKDVEELSNTLTNYIISNLHQRYGIGRREKNLHLVKSNILDERFRSKRELISDEEIDENCETKLKKSYDCYKDELSLLSSALETHQENALTPESRIIHQNNAGCDLIRNILDKCDKLLCNPPASQDSNVDTYNEYLQTILPNFNVLECRF